MRFFIITSIIFALFSCGKKNRFADIDISNSSIKPVSINRFDKDFFSVDTSNISTSLLELKEKYGNFTELRLEESLVGKKF